MSTPKRPGRPSVDEHGLAVSIHLRVPARDYDDWYAKARQERVSVPELLRHKLNAAEKKKP